MLVSTSKTTVRLSPEGSDGIFATVVPACVMVSVAASVSPTFSTTTPKRTTAGSLWMTVCAASA